MPRITVTSKAEAPKATVGIYSYGIKGSVQPKAQFDFDLTKFRDPSGQKQFSGVLGTHVSVKEWMKDDERIAALIADCKLIADDLIKPKMRDGKAMAAQSAWLSFAFHDFH